MSRQPKVEKLFNKIGNVYFPGQYEAINKVPPGIYSLVFNHREYRPELIFSEHSFELPKKLYGIDSIFVNRIITTFKEKPQNLGVLLTGYKGTGKTILCKYICNKLNIPVIRLPKRLGSEYFNLFLNAIDQDFVLFIDEFEKKFKEENEELLDVMDGMFNIEHKILFLLTSNNETTMNSNLFNRPNRIYYTKRFLDLDQEIVDEIIQDKLVDKNEKDGLLNCLNAFEHVTMDNLNATIAEMNQFKCSAHDAISCMNIPLKPNKSKFGLK